MLIPEDRPDKQSFLPQQVMNDRQCGLVINPISFINGNTFKIFCHASQANAFCVRITILGIQVAVFKP